MILGSRASDTAGQKRAGRGAATRLPRCLARLFAGAFWCIAPAATGENTPRSPASDPPLPGVVRAPLPTDEVKGLPLATVFYDLRGSAGITGGDERTRLEIEQVFGIRAGAVFDPQVAQVGLMRVRQLRFVREARFTVYESIRPGHLALALSVTLGTRDEAAGPRGMASGRAGYFPTLYQDERASFNLLLNGGVGLFSDGSPWFGNAASFTGPSPIAFDPASGDSATWFESSVEYGLGGVIQLGQGNVWAYGAASMLTSFSTGQDLFRSDSRSRTAIEDAYVGVVFQPDDSPWVVNASVGRQNWQLNDGFLFSQFAGSANAGPLPGLFLNPRTAYEMTALLKVQRDHFRLEAFYLDPNEIEFLESDTTFAGLNASYRFPAGWEASLAYYEVPESKTAFAGGTVPREGQQTGNARVATTRLFLIEVEVVGQLERK